MTIALEIRGLWKRYTVGIRGCVASAEVLRGIDLTVRSGEAIGLVGDADVGKSTLLLCAAGLLAADAGDIEWFGTRDRSAAAQRVMYHVTRTDLMRAGPLGEPHIHLLDVRELPRIDSWIAARKEAGDTVIVAARVNQDVQEMADRIVMLRGGVLRPHVRPATRVAEAARHR